MGSWTDNISGEERVMLRTLSRFKSVIYDVIGSVMASNGREESRNLFVTNESIGRVWDKSSTWRYVDTQITNQGGYTVYRGTLERGLYRVTAELRYEFCVESIHTILPSGPLEMGRDLFLHSGIRPEFTAGPWWDMMPDWIEELGEVMGEEKRRLAIAARDAELERERKAAVIQAGNAAEFIQTFRKQKARK